jgi:hypothetical protein
MAILGVPQESEPAGDLGINSVILKSINIETSHQRLKSIKDIKVSAITNCEYSGNHFWVTDGNRNTFKIIPANDWFQKGDMI